MRIVGHSHMYSRLQNGQQTDLNIQEFKRSESRQSQAVQAQAALDTRTSSPKPVPNHRQHRLKGESTFGGSYPAGKEDSERSGDSIYQKGKRNRIVSTDTIPLAADNNGPERLSPLQSYVNRKLYGGPRCDAQD